MLARRIVLGILIGGIALAAFILSFDAQLILVTRIADVDQHIAWLYPILVDAFIVTTTLSALWIPQTTRMRAAYPWLAMALFSIVSIGGNALHVLAFTTTQYPWIAIAIYTVPPIGLLIAVHLATTTVFRPQVHAPTLTRPAKRQAPRSPSAITSSEAVSRRSDIPEPTPAELLAMSEDQQMSMQQIADAVGRSKSWVGKNIKDERDRRLGDTPARRSINAEDA